MLTKKLKNKVVFIEHFIFIILPCWRKYLLYSFSNFVLLITCFIERVLFLNSVLGCVDGTHISINAPHDDADAYLNRKKYHSVQLQVICDNKKKFTDVFTGYPGSVHDARVMDNSFIYPKLPTLCSGSSKAFNITKQLKQPSPPSPILFSYTHTKFQLVYCPYPFTPTFIFSIFGKIKLLELKIIKAKIKNWHNIKYII